MFKKIGVMAIALILPFIITGCGKSEQPQEEKSESAQNIVEENQNKESYKITIEKHVNEKVSIEYPQIEGLGEELDARLNKRFRDDALSYQNQEEGNLIHDPKVVTYEVKCDIKTQTPDMISISMPSYISMPESAHPTSFMGVYNINPKTGEDIKLSETGAVSEYAKNILSGKNYTAIKAETDPEVNYDAEVKEFFTQEDNVFYTSAKELEDELNEYNMFYIKDEKVVIIINVPHALGDYAELVMDK